ncbi:DUF4142 domain-containing protein [Streptomyces sp. ODS05-4]|uniref:DUF4142 domain-containing protein n=1 Tax=Streptomyces sp. ODS05-4 TaxID=2944939 RepID=UPI00210CC934|nr:DUF4142 domain-containing protein [Streptomyces sp. ODS05-4]
MKRTHRWAATALTTLALTGMAAGPASADAPSARAADGSGAILDTAFLRVSHQGHLTEIAAGEDARKQASSACVRDIGAALVRDHTRMDADTRALADRLGVDLPAAPSAEQQEMLAGLMGRHGGAGYDAHWLTALTGAHEKTLTRIDAQLARGKDAQVTAAAKAVRPVVASHLDMVRGGKCRHSDGTGSGQEPGGTPESAPPRKPGQSHDSGGSHSSGDSAAPKAIHAGNGGQAATLAAGVPVAVAVPVLAVGGILVAAGAFWAASRLRRHDR